MGWKCAADARGKLLAGTEWDGGVVTASAAAAAAGASLPAGACVVVDANAMLRSATFDRLSAYDIAKSMLNKVAKSNPASVQIFFDSNDPSAFPPQRAQVHAERYPDAKQLNMSAINAIATKFGAVAGTDLPATSADLLPLRTYRGWPWQTCWGCPVLKTFVWRIFVAALRHAAIEKKANGGLKSISIQIYGPDGNVITLGDEAGSLIECPRRFGEADLQTFDAARVHANAGKAVIIYSIDTDFLLMTMAAAPFIPTEPFIIHLKTSITDGAKLIATVGGADVVTRLNTVFWLLGLGCDYADPLTKQGFYTRDIVDICKGLGAGLVPAIGVVAGIVTLDLASTTKILGTLKRRADPTGVPGKRQRIRAPQNTALGDLLFCLRYYGFMFPEHGDPYPPASNTYLTSRPSMWQFPAPQ